MTIYTGRGNEDQTDLRTMDRVSKASPRIEACIHEVPSRLADYTANAHAG